MRIAVAPTGRALPALARWDVPTSRLHCPPSHLQVPAPAMAAAPPRQTHQPPGDPQPAQASQRPDPLQRTCGTQVDRCRRRRPDQRLHRTPRPVAPTPCPARPRVLAPAHPQARHHCSATAQAAAPAPPPVAAARQSTPARSPHPPVRRLAPGQPTRLSFPTQQSPSRRPAECAHHTASGCGWADSLSLRRWMKRRKAAVACVLARIPHTRKRPENRAL